MLMRIHWLLACSYTRCAHIHAWSGASNEAPVWIFWRKKSKYISRTHVEIRKSYTGTHTRITTLQYTHADRQSVRHTDTHHSYKSATTKWQISKINNEERTKRIRKKNIKYLYIVMNLMNSNEKKNEMNWNEIQSRLPTPTNVYSNDKQLSEIWTNPMHFLCSSTFAWLVFSSVEKVCLIDNGVAAAWWCRFACSFQLISNVLWCIVFLKHTAQSSFEMLRKLICNNDKRDSE